MKLLWVFTLGFIGNEIFVLLTRSYVGNFDVYTNCSGGGKNFEVYRFGDFSKCLLYLKSNMQLGFFALLKLCITVGR